MTLRKPPKPPHATANLVGRMVGLVVLLALFGAIVWVAATNNQIPLTERGNPLVNPPGEHILVGDELIHVRLYGPPDGEVATLVHDDVVAGGVAVAPLARVLGEAGWRVIVPDLIGFGLSSRPVEPVRAYTVAGQAERLADLVAEMELEPGVLAGMGWGGTVAAELAVSYPEAVTTLVLVNTADIPAERDGWETVEALPAGVGRAVSYTRQGSSSTARERFFAGCEAGGWCDDGEVVEGYDRAVSVPGTAESVRARRITRPASVAGSRLGEIDVPVHIVWSRPSSDEPRSLAGRFADARIHTIAGAGDRPELAFPLSLAEVFP